MDYSAYILPAYGLAALLVGGLVAHTLLSAWRVRRALGRTQDRA